MSNDFQVTNNFDKVIKELLNKQPHVKVGILGKTDSRQDSLSNAEIGSIHEFGSIARNIPRRSFLRDPLSKYLGNVINSVKKQDLTIREMLDAVGARAVAICQKSFQNSNDGEWTPSRKLSRGDGNGQTLIETRQLQKSITYEVVE